MLPCPTASIPVMPTLRCPWGYDTQASLLHPLQQRFCGDRGYPKSSNGSGVARPALMAVGQLCTANQTPAVLPSEGTRGVCVSSSLPGHTPPSSGPHGMCLGGNHEGAAAELLAVFICLGAEVTVFTVAMTIAMHTEQNKSALEAQV